MSDEHPARVAARASQAAAAGRRKDEWLALFAENGVVEDPVGPSGFDPEGKGHHGREAISRFYDMTIANTDRLEFLVDDVLVCGDECVNIGTIRTTLGGNVIDAEGVFVYRVDDDGRIASLRAFWEVERAMKTVRPAAEAARG
ncbi:MULTISPECIES: nuclear transport factor 2 family protein [Rhodococcus]|uniref:Nuclear transport factor 2 family protein n=1 Tax=Rhodococcus indonesiensis TaxID=3055869 RepID=A0ABT7RIH7_9NOCA|nr:MULTISPECIES: nuclear transport factor 2 family protein [Rhodococcus]MDM7486806.1 nuclear transport factor 2 family protein [Rhodococcus indonesiensis]MDO2381057.1 nuclear transport factor 2 family protein [Rhodococcus ruber]QDC13203.1 nuclear transport factor 2 family protein [Rhodococcus ruber]WKK11715.1 nuclear transport factor 2 family protein [Rhodococcus ruber]